MNSNQTKQNIEKDDMNLKMHLNTSLENSGISVSEALINRTLTAIKNQSDNTPAIEEIKQPETKIIPWTRYLRNLTAVAAAGLILVMGLNSLGQKSMKNDVAENSKEKSYDMAASESAPNTANNSFTADEDANSFSFKTDQAFEDNKLSATGKDQNMDAGDVKMNAVKEEFSDADETGISTTLSDIYTLSFGDISPITAEAAESVNIIEGATNNAVFLSNQADIDQFYNLLAGFTFAEGAQLSGSNKYLIRISSTGASFTLSVEDSYINTSYVYGEDRVEGKYDTVDHGALLLELDQLYQKYNQ